CRRRHGRGFVDEEIVGVQRFIADKIIGAAAVLGAAAFRNDGDHRAAVIAVLSRVIVSQDLNLADRVLVDGHTYFVRTARFTGIQTIYRRHGRTPALAGNVRQVRAKAFAYRFDVVVVGRAGNKTQQRGYVATFRGDERQLVRRQSGRQIRAFLF